MNDFSIAWNDLFDFIWEYFVFPLENAMTATNLFSNTTEFINSLINAILNLFRESPIDNLVFIDPSLIAQFIGILLLILIIIYLFNIVKFALNSLKIALTNLTNNKKRKIWRKQWKR